MPKIHANGLDFYYELNGSGIPIVFINGIFSNSTSWAAQVEDLKNQFATLVYDYREQGQTGFSSTRYPFRQHIEDLNEILNQLSLEKVYLAGISYGATIATQFAYTYPEKVEKLALISGVVQPDAKTFNTFEFLMQYFWNSTLQEYYKVIMLFGLGPELYNKIAPMLPQLAEDFNARFMGNKENVYRLIHAALEGQMPDLEKVKSLEIPVLLIAGEYDNLVV